MYISIYTYARESMTKEPDWPQHDPSTSMLSPNSILPTLRLIALSFRKKEFGARVENVHTHTHTHICMYIYIYMCTFSTRAPISFLRDESAIRRSVGRMHIYIYICVCVCVCVYTHFRRVRKIAKSDY